VSGPGIGLCFLGLFAAAFWLTVFAIVPASRFAQKFARSAETDSQRRKAEGYKVNPSALYSCCAKTRIRAVAFAALLLALTSWFWSTSRTR